MSNRTILQAVSLLLLFTACSQPKNRIRLEGSIDNVRHAEFYAYSEDGTFNGIDTIRIENGKFTYERELSQPVILTLLYPNFSRTYIVAEPGKTIRMTGEAAKLGEADITGNEDNKRLTAFRQKNAGKNDNDIRLAASDFIRSNSRSLAAIAVFKQYFAEARQPSPDTTLSLLEELRRAQPKNAELAAIDARLRQQLGTAAGRTLPDFTATDIDGRTVTPAQFKGKPLVIAFWASWSNESFPLIKSLRRIHKAYGTQVGVLGVSLDTEMKQCRRRVETDSMKFSTVCDGAAFDGDLVRRLGMRYLPSAIFVDAAGRVVARDLKADRLEQLVAEHVRTAR